MREKEYKNMKYRQLQKLAKEHGIKANLSNSSLIKQLLEVFEKSKASRQDYSLEIAEAELHEQEALIRKTKRKSRGYNPTIWRELEAAEIELESAKFKIEVIKRKNQIEEIFWRFPHLGTQILEKLDNVSLANCREISTWWKKFVDSDKTFWIQQIQEHISISNQSVKKTLQKENYETLQYLAKSSKKSFDSAMYRCENKEKPTTLEMLYDLLLSSSLVEKKFVNDNRHLSLVKLIIDNLENKNPWLETGGLNALSQAARLDNMEAYKLISKELDEKKSKR
jgi:hypothetical protein